MNTENVGKPYLSCYYLESGITFAPHEILFCCDRASPATIHPMADAGKTVDAFMETRDRVIRENQGADPPCEGCNRFQKCVPTDRGIDYMNFSTHYFCNFSCTYCSLQTKKAQDKNRPEAYDALEIAEELKRRGLLSKSLYIDCAPGEITVHPKKDKYYEFIEENACSVNFSSNAGRFDPRLARILGSSPLNRMIVSIDCGTEETFRKIRGVDMFRQVIENLAEYRKYSPNIWLKYILLDQNCGDEDLSGFIHLCNELDLLQIVISGDVTKSQNSWTGKIRSGYEEHIVSAAVKLAEGAIKSGIVFYLFDQLGPANLREIYRRFAALPEVVSAEQQLDTILSASRIICYGAGGNCGYVLNQIEELGLRKPDVIWDMKAGPGQKLCTGDSCEYPMCPPDFDSLEDNTETGMFITITSSTVNQELAQTMKTHGFSNLLTYDELYLALMAKWAKYRSKEGDKK